MCVEATLGQDFCHGSQISTVIKAAISVENGPNAIVAMFNIQIQGYLYRLSGNDISTPTTREYVSTQRVAIVTNALMLVYDTSIGYDSIAQQNGNSFRNMGAIVVGVVLSMAN